MTIVCFGAAHVDRTARCHAAFSWGSSNPVSVAAGYGGVALNVARNLARLGRHVILISAIGRDADGEQLMAALSAEGIDTSSVLRPDAHNTANYTAVLDRDGELLFGIADMDIYDAMTPEHLTEAMAGVDEPAAWFVDANLPQASLAWLADAVPRSTPLFAAAVSPAKAPRLRPLLGRVRALFANRREAAALLARDVETTEQACQAARALHAQGVETAFVTLGADGVAVHGADGDGVFTPPPTRIHDVNGAGDAFAAVIIEALLAEKALRAAVGHGLAAASLTAETDGAVDGTLSRKRIAARAGPCR